MVGRSRNLWGLEENLQSLREDETPFVMDGDDVVMTDVEVEVKDPRQHFSLFIQAESKRNNERDQALHKQRREEAAAAAAAADKRAKKKQQKRVEELVKEQQQKTKAAEVLFAAFEHSEIQEAQRVQKQKELDQVQTSAHLRLAEERNYQHHVKVHREMKAKQKAGEQALEQQRRDDFTDVEEKSKEQAKGYGKGEPRTSELGGFWYHARIVPYDRLVLPRILRLNFQKIKSVKDVWITVGEFVMALDTNNPTYDFQQEHYEEIWAYCVRNVSRSGEFLVTVGLVPNLSQARRDIEVGAQSIKQTKALRKAMRNRKRNLLKRTPTTQYQVVQVAPNTIMVKKIFDPPTAPTAHLNAFKPPTAPREHYDSHRPSEPRNSAYNKEGDVVGDSAPELGIENKGRSMLEKMGWSAGMTLGLENRGIAQPVGAVVKYGTAGIGMDIKQLRNGGRQRN